MLEECAAVYRERNAVYGDTYKRCGPVMTALFQEQPRIENEGDSNRYQLFVQLVGKIARYAANFNQGGHDDSLQDLAVYATMLRELDMLEKVENDLVPF